MLQLQKLMIRQVTNQIYFVKFINKTEMCLFTFIGQVIGAWNREKWVKEKVVAKLGMMLFKKEIDENSVVIIDAESKWMSKDVLKGYQFLITGFFLFIFNDSNRLKIKQFPFCQDMKV